MAKKFNLSKGLAGRLTGGLIGGAASAVWDKYVVPMLGDTIAGYENYVKVAVGAALPALVKNEMVTSVGDSLIAIGANNIVSGLLDSTDTGSGSGDGSGDGVGRALVNGGRFPQYRRFVQVNGNEKKAPVKVNSVVR